jgi:enamine deaminase RidA (YjgF/YER057c/UK114 family)
MSAEETLRRLGLRLPDPPKPVGSYLPAVRAGDLVFVSGQLPFVEGKVQSAGRVGEDISVETGYQAARICALNALSIVRSEVGSLDRVTRVVRIVGYVRSASGFGEQAKVVNGASDLMVEIFGDAGRHSRAAVGVSELPLGAAVEVEVAVQVKV